jgi:allophanate hydrolase
MRLIEETLMREMEIKGLHSRFLEGHQSITSFLFGLWEKAHKEENRGVFISLLSKKQLEKYTETLEEDLRLNPGIFLHKPLFGVPFAVSDAIDIMGTPTTLACPDISTTGFENALIIDLLLEAGAVPLGKANMDQFSLGTTGLSSPFPQPINATHPDFIPGGSCSGAAIAVAKNIVSFAIGVDCLGSGLISGAMNGVISAKATRGLISMHGVFPTSPSLDSLCLYSSSHEDIRTISQILWKYDPNNPYSREPRRILSDKTPFFPHRLAIPLEEQLHFGEDQQGKDLWLDMIRHWEEQEVEIVPIDFAPFFRASALIMQGPWLAEAWASLEEYVDNSDVAIHPDIREILEKGKTAEAKDLFRHRWEIEAIQQQIIGLRMHVDGFLLPSLPHYLTVEAARASNLAELEALNKFSGFLNILGLCGLSVPFRSYAQGLPWSYNLIGFPGYDLAIQSWAHDFHHYGHTRRIELAVPGAFQKGLEFNRELTKVGGQYVRDAQTSPNYRMFITGEDQEAIPGLARIREGNSFPIEIWSIPVDEFAKFVQSIPPPLGVGKLELSDQSWVSGILCASAETLSDISTFGGWRNYIMSRKLGSGV